jgi:spore coat polysaccharide biosynthesis protein SpsF
MSFITVQIQARLSSTRLPGKVLYTLGSKRILDWVVERAQTAETPEQIIFTVGDSPENDAICEWCDRNGITYETGPEENLLRRHLQAAKTADSDPVVRITGDCPFVPPSEIDRVIQEHDTNHARYTTNVTDEMPTGTAVDVIDRAILEELDELGDTHPVIRPRDHPEKWDTAFTPNERWTEYSDAHTAVDTPNDYWTLIDAIDAVGTDPFEVTKWISER